MYHDMASDSFSQKEKGESRTLEASYDDEREILILLVLDTNSIVGDIDRQICIIKSYLFLLVIV